MKSLRATEDDEQEAVVMYCNIERRYYERFNRKKIW